MPHTHTTLSFMSDGEFLRHVDNVRDPLTTTTLETELFARLTKYTEDWADVIDLLVDQGAESVEDLRPLFALTDLFNKHEIYDIRKDGVVVVAAAQVLEQKLDMLNVLAEQQIENIDEARGAAAMLAVIDKHNIADETELDALLQRAAEINAITDQVGDLLARLNSLTNKEHSHES